MHKGNEATIIKYMLNVKEQEHLKEECKTLSGFVALSFSDAW